MHEWGGELKMGIRCDMQHDDKGVQMDVMTMGRTGDSPRGRRNMRIGPMGLVGS